jgi:hypothetical protein
MTVIGVESQVLLSIFILALILYIKVVEGAVPKELAVEDPIFNVEG